MKKFLSIFLALAVAFTFTFGSTMSAFATVVPTDATDAEYLELLAQEETNANAKLDAQYQVAVATVNAGSGVQISATTSETLDVDKKFYLEQLAVAYKAAQTEIKNTTIGYKTTKATEITYPAKSAQNLLDYAVADGDVDKCKTALAKAQFEANKADYVAALKTIDTSIYSAEKKAGGWVSPAVDGKTYTVPKEYADAIIAYAIKQINEAVLDQNDTADAIIVDADSLKTLFEGYTDYNASTKVYKLDATAYGDIYTAAQAKADKENADAALAVVKSQINQNVVAANNIAEGKTYYDAALWNAFIADYKTVMNTLAENNVAIADVPDCSFVKDSKNVITLVEPEGSSIQLAVANAKVLEAAAATVKAMKNTDGTVKYDAELIDEALLQAIVSEYTKAKTGANSDLETSAAIARFAISANEIDYATAIEKAQAKKAATDAYVDNKEAYLPLEYAAYKTALDAYCAAVDAATLQEDLTKAGEIFAAAIASDKLMTKAYVSGTLYTEPKMASALASAQAMAAGYVAELNSGKAQEDYITYDPDDVKNFLMENGARKPEEILAAYSALKADIAKTETPNQAKAAAAALDTTIEALPAVINMTLADKDAVLAAYNAYDEASDAVKAAVKTVNVSKITTAYGKIKGLDNAAITDAKAEIEKGGITLADKDAIKAFIAAVDAYFETYEENATYYEYATIFKETLRALEGQAVADAIAALPTDITAESKDAVEAAKKLYDDFVADYNDLENSYDAVDKLKSIYNANIEKLEAAVATIGQLTKYDDIHAKADLLDMSRKLTIWRTSKTSIRVTAVGSVANITDNGYTVKYSFYKKAPGSSSYKLVKTTTSNKYTYTNLKKGTNKFQVKVKVYDADGKLVASKWTYYRAAKVK